MRAFLATAVSIVWTLMPATGAAQTEKAKKHFEQAEMFMEVGVYDKAIEEYQAAYQLAPTAHILLFNIALAFENWGKPAEALAHYARYLALEPDGEKSSEATARAIALERAAESAKAASGTHAEADGAHAEADAAHAEKQAGPRGDAVVEVARPRPARAREDRSPDPPPRRPASDIAVASSAERKDAPGKTRRLVGVITAATGVAATGIGGYFALSARSDWQAARDEGCDDDGICPTPAGVALTDDAARAANLGTLFIGAGVAVAAVGGYLWFTGRTEDDPASRGVALTPQLGPGSAGFAVWSEF